ncbi:MULTISPECIES: CBS domain-containing protein [unclassified Streptomyces]|uniref:CBS domain-containing protein n=1 Tax=unclassified Streptomyces TaxID=2593676 RepID=UPI0022721FB2|nr:MULTISPECIES: CBS domain-containing protein [unclassified Streptomyces]MCY0922528.1 CBS domain-containing protein [Streptomyces sp. H27-G5]MCY0962187.1 CBS domain-containing protein [Streptomyces sp. H27-H5]
MKHTQVGEVMTAAVISIDRSTTFREIVKLLAAYDITGLPVVDEDDRVVGVVSESDLIARTARTAADIMSAPAVTVRAQESVAEAGQLMTRRGVERLPVTDGEERLIGIVSRRDLLRVFLRPDAEIRRHVSEDVLSDTIGAPTGAVDVHVLDGVVTLTGRLERQSQIALALRLAARLDGVVAVVDELTARTDDSRLIPPERGAHPITW